MASKTSKSSRPTPTVASALHDIQGWSLKRPPWQRDALRRIVLHDMLKEADLAELDRMCRAVHKADESKEPAVTPHPLSADHLPPAPGAESSVTLVSVGKLERVNRLPSDQVLKFGDFPGLTVIYGDNGSGKSGYVRVIKKTCRTRGAAPVIKQNAFEPPSSKPATAEIVCRIGNVDKPIRWSDGIAGPSELANIFVFDSTTAVHYLEEDGPAVFTPRGLDVLPKLSGICDAIRGRIQKDIDKIKPAITATANSWKIVPGTAVATAIGGLSAGTKKNDIEALAKLTPEEMHRLKELNETLKSDARQKAKETRASAARLRSFESNLATLIRELSDVQCDAVKKLIENAASSLAASKAFAIGQFDASYLPGTGGELWKALFMAARDFSVEVAYKDKEFPVTSPGKCILCQQDLDDQARERFDKFDAFCKNKSEQVTMTAATDLAQGIKKINALVALTCDLAVIDADLSNLTIEQKAAIADLVKSADARLSIVRDNVAKRAWIDPGLLPALSATTVIASLVQALDARATMEESADDPETRKKLSVERNELAAREWLAGVKDDVFAQIDRYSHVVTLETCQKDTATRPITEKSTELTKQIVTDAFCKQFESEVKALGLKTISIKMEEIKGKKAETRFGLRLVGAGDQRVFEIASEGEQRCIALAAFLAELSQASHQSSLVFDDPVSSLDHWHRNKIASRLVDESNVRQVIIFTHDAVFLNDLQTQSEHRGGATAFRHVEWIADHPGYCHDGLPWECKTPLDQIDKLEKRQREIAGTWQSQPNENNIADMRGAYSRLRATIERIVERVVFADVIFRFRSYVSLSNLNDVVGFTKPECEEIQRLYKRCCDVTEAHDVAAGKKSAVPDPSDFKKDVADVKSFVVAIKQRRKSVAEGLSGAQQTSSPN